MKLNYLLLLLQAVLITATPISTLKNAWSETYTTTYSTQFSKVGGLFGFFAETETTFLIHTPRRASSTTIQKGATTVTAPTTIAKDIKVTIGSDGEQTTISTIYVLTPVRYATTTFRSYSDFTGTVPTTALSTSYISGKDGLNTTLSVYYVALPTDLLKTTKYQDYTGSVTTTYSTSYIVNSSDNEEVTSTIYFVNQPRPSGITSYFGYSGTDVEFYSTSTEYNLGFSNLIFGFIPTPVYYVHIPYRYSSTIITMVGHDPSSSTFLTQTSTILGDDGESTTLSIFYVKSPLRFETSTAYTQGTQTGYTTTLATVKTLETGTDGIHTSKIIYSVAIPTHLKYVTSFDYWPATFASTYETDITTTTGSDGSATAQTVFYVHTPRNPGVTSLIGYTGTETEWYSTSVVSEYGFSGLIFGLWSTTVYFVHTPIRNSYATTTIGTTGTQSGTYSTQVYSTVGPDGETTTASIYYVASRIREATTTIYTQGYQTDSTITFESTYKNVVGTDGFSTTLLVYSVAIPTHIKKVTSYTDGGSIITTYSTSVTTIVGTDNSNTAATIFYVQTPRHSGITSYVPYAGSVTEFYSTSIKFELGFRSKIFGLWETTVYFVHTPIHASTTAITKGYFGSTTRTYFTEVNTITNSNGEETTISTFLVQTPLPLSTRTVYSQGTQTGSTSTFATDTSYTTGTDGIETTVTIFSVVIPTHLQKITSYIKGPTTGITTFSTGYTTVTGSDGFSTAQTIFYVETPQLEGVVKYTAWTNTFESTTTNYSFSVGFLGLVFGVWSYPVYTVYLPEASPIPSISTSSGYVPTSVVPSTSSSNATESTDFTSESSFPTSFSVATSEVSTEAPATSVEYSSVEVTSSVEASSSVQVTSSVEASSSVQVTSSVETSSLIEFSSTFESTYSEIEPSTASYEKSLSGTVSVLSGFSSSLGYFNNTSFF
ncbi:hypothetical protein Kpol_1045p8 [Vanderwaltozyma polyspora DSM 70294]|uniref:Uncharacterized protein n=1 Tax=Vanderwaltozyma polyspora (strain ATCC 22028 / DSM 70294 / BCRC 21397 / CBS 2163 / NBRC 10782 / NRRL Y-8283 / UCD 57-17) TaxID=436907 RepID=A7TI17_VANPO|nr:uncharacterized protein Kpol_1045p8 [Vanderwaltozyma polyspora DSM 70294]EDO18024.1 hypothetical protein Kpol_1045p8 [Vanderwaltozyma polyspora DSM 70294]